MFQRVDTKDTQAVRREVQNIYQNMFPKGNASFVPTAFQSAIDCFSGRCADYLPIDALYHDFEHTLQGTLCLVRLLQQRHQAGLEPVLTARQFELGIMAILLHDTGYLKHRGDHQGTGAKYTAIHVHRSAEFAHQLLAEKGYPPAEIVAVQQMIRCTGVNTDVTKIPFAHEWERVVGFALATADLLGQMAATDYVDKLPVLYREFEEAAHFKTGEKPNAVPFSSVDDLMRKTPAFWEKYVIPKIDKTFLGLYKFLASPYPDGANYYVQSVEANIERLKRQLQPVLA